MNKIFSLHTLYMTKWDPSFGDYVWTCIEVRISIEKGTLYLSIGLSKVAYLLYTYSS